MSQIKELRTTARFSTRPYAYVSALGHTASNTQRIGCASGDTRTHQKTKYVLTLYPINGNKFETIYVYFIIFEELVPNI